MNLNEFLTISEKTILLDGGMGTELAKYGHEMGGQNCVTNPDAVLAVHKSYVDCGIDLLLTNTLTMNRIYIDRHMIGVDVRDVNLAGAKLAKSAVGDGQFVLGDMSTTSIMLEPVGELKRDDALVNFKEQAAVLVEGGVDGFIIETMFDLEETLIAVKACKDVSDLPIMASMTFSTLDKGGRTIMGNSAQDCAKALTEAGVTTVGANCGDLTPLQLAEIVSLMKEVTSLPTMIQPNAGMPEVVNDQPVFNMTPSEFAEGVYECVQAGAKLVGGCCGTSPAHIQALADKLGR